MFERKKKVACSYCGNCKDFESWFMYRELGFRYKCMVCNQIWVEGLFSITLIEKGKLIISPEEVDVLLEPIRDHGHCWGMIAQQIIKDEIESRIKLDQNKRLGPYGDWPVDGH